MTSTSKGFDTTAQVKKFISTLTEGYAAIYNMCLIESDGKISISHWQEVDKDCKKFKIPYKFYIGIRTRGVESAERHSHIVERTSFFDDTLACDIEIQYLASIKKYVVTYARAI